MSATLASRLPAAGETLSPDDVLLRFVDWASEIGLELYPAQEEAILELLSGKHVVLSTPTGSGKSLVAMAHAFLARSQGRRFFYTCPIKALVNEKFFALCDAFGAAEVGLSTGDASVNREAKIICCTAEILANASLRDADAADCVVMDEFHYYGDRDRGMAWQLPLIALPKAQFLLMSATLGDLYELGKRLEVRSGREVAHVRSATRPVPLDYQYRETVLAETMAELLRTGRIPVYLVHFTQRAAAEQAQNLLSIDLCTKEEKERLRQALQDAPLDTPFGKELGKFLRHGVGLHHAGLLPRYRRLVERLAQQGLLKAICGTDTLGVGVNVPIRTVLFTQLCKYDGVKTGILTARDFHQIAGRAGRKGFDDRGSVVAQAPEHVIENLKLAAKAAAGGNKKFVKKQPPDKGFVHWDEKTFARLQEATPEALESRFEISFGTLVQLLPRASEEHKPGPARGGYGRLVELIKHAHLTDGAKKRQKKIAAQRFRALRQAGVISVLRWEGRPGAVAEVSDLLQDDFSIHRSLTLWLLDTWPGLDRTQEGYALDLVTLVESTLENPDVVLWKQLDKLKGEKVAELKAQGMEYDQRMEELAKLEYPKPLADLVYGTFDAFRATRPWLGVENIKPKSVARELYERALGFHEYVREYQLQRSEGVLLRYLSDVYRTISQSLPEAARDEAVEDFVAWLRAVVRGTDASLLDEWEKLRDGVLEDGAGRQMVVPVLKPRAYDLAKDPRAFGIRVRAELHAVVRSLARGDFAAVRGGLRPGTIEWTDERLAAARDAFVAAHGAILTTPAARRPNLTQLTEDGERRWIVRQGLLDAEGEFDVALECVVEPPDPVHETEPLCELLEIR